MSIQFDPTITSALIDSINNQKAQPTSLVDAIPRASSPSGDLLGTVIKARSDYLTFKLQLTSNADVQSTKSDYSKYLQFPSAHIKQLAQEIVNPTDSSDIKAQKVTSWVIDNIQYQDDWITNGEGEHWALPTETVAAGVGDCEDGAFLIHSLLLACGVDPERLRTYGGEVVAGIGAQTGGHGWTAYKRSSDEEWVVLDYSYYPNKKSADERVPMRLDNRYIDDYFYVNIDMTVETPYKNRVHDPDAYKPGGFVDEYV